MPDTIRELFKKKKAWTKGAYATNGKSGINVVEFDRLEIADNQDAVCFCLSGAVAKVAVSGMHQNVMEAKLAGVIRAMFGKRIRLSHNKSMGNETVIVRFNDHEDTTIEEIRQVVKVANV